MKKILVYEMWLYIISWCLILNNCDLLGIISSFVLFSYTCFYCPKINIWRSIAIFLILTIISIYSISFTNLTSIYQKIIPFLVMINLFNALLNEEFKSIKYKNLRTIYLYLFLAMNIFVFVWLIIPFSPSLPFYKLNIIVLIANIFLPSLLELKISFTKRTIYVLYKQQKEN